MAAFRRFQRRVRSPALEEAAIMNSGKSALNTHQRGPLFPRGEHKPFLFFMSLRALPRALDWRLSPHSSIRFRIPPRIFLLYCSAALPRDSSPSSFLFIATHCGSFAQSAHSCSACPLAPSSPTTRSRSLVQQPSHAQLWRRLSSPGARFPFLSHISRSTPRPTG